MVKDFFVMDIRGYFDKTFSGENAAQLSWVEKNRKSPLEYHGKEAYGKLSELGIIPRNLGDAFLNEMSSKKISIRFSQGYNPTSPITSFQILRFLFYDETDFPPGEIKFRTEGSNHIRLESEELNLYKDGGRFGNNTFTETGKAIMEDLISHRRDILNVRGMRLGDYCQLEKLLSRIEEYYKEGEFNPTNIYRGA